MQKNLLVEEIEGPFRVYTDYAEPKKETLHRHGHMALQTSIVRADIEIMTHNGKL